MRSQQKLGIANSAAQAQHSRLTARSGLRKHAFYHVGTQRANRGTREMPLRKTGIELLVILQLAFQNLIHGITIHEATSVTLHKRADRRE